MNIIHATFPSVEDIDKWVEHFNMDREDIISIQRYENCFIVFYWA